jgi:hypothetical protein
MRKERERERYTRERENSKNVRKKYTEKYVIKERGMGER